MVYLEVCGERRRHLDLLRGVFGRLEGAIAAAGLEPIGGPLATESVGGIALGLWKLADGLVAVVKTMRELMDEECRDLAVGVAEHMLACYHGCSSGFTPEPTRLGLVQEMASRDREAIQSVAVEVTARFKCLEGGGVGDASAGTSGATMGEVEDESKEDDAEE